MKVIKRFVLFFLWFNTSLLGFGQHAEVDTFAMHIPDSVTQTPGMLAGYIGAQYMHEEQIARVVYVWITNNISYDSLAERRDTLQHENLVMFALKTRTGKCKHYSALTTAICRMLGLEAYSVLGYTKKNGLVETQKDHAWNIIKLGGHYYLFDPTWDATAKRFDTEAHEFIFEYYKKAGDSFITNHMPYDPVMRLLDYPIKHKTFFSEKNLGKHYLDYKKNISDYDNLSEAAKLQVLLKRAEDNGLNIPKLAFLYKRLKYFVSTCQH